MTKQTARKIRGGGLILFCLYIALLVYVLFLSDRYGRGTVGAEIRYNLEPLREIRRFWENRHMLGKRAVFLNLAGNVLLFIPFAAILPVLLRGMRHFWKIMALTVLLSLAVETAQLVTRAGAFDVDDLILNVLGGAAGWLIFVICNQVRRKVYG